MSADTNAARGATPKQIDLLIRLWKRSGQYREFGEAVAKQNGRAWGPDFEREFEIWLRTEEAPKQSLEWMREQIDKANARLGWDQHEAKASAKQIAYIRDMEMKLFGEHRTQPTEPLTYAEANAQIRNLKDLIKQSKAPDFVPTNWTGVSLSDVLGAVNPD